jgi:hypothetical protein
MRRLCCPSCILPNKIVGIISWLVMSRSFSWIYYHVACRLCREMTWLQNRDMIFRAQSSYSMSYRTCTASMLSTNSQMIPKWTAITL